VLEQALVLVFEQALVEEQVFVLADHLVLVQFEQVDLEALEPFVLVVLEALQELEHLYLLFQIMFFR
jgi:hypothetical protein